MENKIQYDGMKRSNVMDLSYLDIIRKNVDLTRQEEVFRQFDSQDECMGNITHFWNGDDLDLSKFDFAIIGFPQDIGIRNMGGKHGVRDGPYGFRKPFYSLSNHFEKPRDMIIDLGNIKIDLDADLQDIHTRMVEVISCLIKLNVFPIVIGGGNDVTYAGAKGIKESGVYNRLGLLSFDAHLNFHDVPGKFISASSMFRIMDDFPDLFNMENVVHFGLRKETISPHYARFARESKMHTYYNDIIQLHSQDKIKNIKKELFQALNQANNMSEGTIITFDMDVCDGCMMPGTSFPLPGGFSPECVISIAKQLSKFKMAVYLDIINLNPVADHNDITSTMAALFLFHFLAEKQKKS
ncbi:MAG: arginase family protein [Candidatus Eremiobacteraeota bacterium]|nr:arginase family protein [Candidatus Eremiobacteraeota bacterium]